MNYQKESKLTLDRILRSSAFPKLRKSEKTIFASRLEEHFERLFTLFHNVYGWQYDFYYHLENLVTTLAENYKVRPAKLKKKDQSKLASPCWYKDEKMIGMACYVDLYGGDFDSLKQRIPYFKELGITYLHLMPLYKSPESDSDGGYAVSNYRETNPALGTIQDLSALAEALNKADINLVLDFVFNHTSDEHEWACKAKEGDEYYQNYYYMFSDKTIPDQYEQNLREIFPQVRRGNFTFNPESQKWVWTTFNNFQWDLNYSNPEVFNAIVSEMLFLANVGCDALRLDALAFIWKEMGTTCENQDKAHSLIQAFNCCLQIVSPALVFKSEAIVHPDEVVKYIHKDECQLSYNPLLMALIWNSLATRKTRLLTHSMQKTGNISSECVWVNYVRCHDDIGWTFDDNAAGNLGINGNDHRVFLNNFYTGRFEGSFANGVAFAENPSTGDCRVCGSLASLCGLEQALKNKDQQAIGLAYQRILLVHSIILSIGGIPLFYAGDELGVLNDYSYLDDPSKAHDARWVNRPNISKEAIENPAHPFVYNGLKELIQVRQSTKPFGNGLAYYLDSPTQHTFAYLRILNNEKVLCIANFSEHEQEIEPQVLEVLGASKAQDLKSRDLIDCQQSLNLGPYEFVWLLGSE